MNNIFSDKRYGVETNYFAGRVYFLEKFKTILKEGSFLKEWLIIGKLGYGKTSLASMFNFIIKEEYKEEKCIYVNIDLKKVKKADLISVTNGSPSSLFYQLLLDKIYLSLKGKRNLYKAEYYGKKLLSTIKSIKLPFVTTKEIDLNPGSAQKYLTQLNRMFRRNRVVLNNLIISFDELNSLKDGIGFKVCSNFCRALQECNSETVSKIKNIEKITTIILSPTTKTDSDLNQRFHFTHSDNLLELDKLDIIYYLKRKSNNGNSLSQTQINKIADSLYFYSGGVPIYFQFLGFDAYELYTAEKTKTPFSENHVRVAFSEGKRNSQLRNKLISDIKNSITKILDSKTDQKIITNIAQLNSLQDETSGLKSLDKEEWMKIICKNITEEQSVKTISFNKIWDYLLEVDFIKKEEHKFRFTSEIHRTILGAI